MLSEFRQDLVSGEWVLLSTGRTHTIRKFEDSYQSKDECPFEDWNILKQDLVTIIPDEKNWRVAVIKNKYPAVMSGENLPEEKVGPFNIKKAVGEHEVVVFKDHDIRFYDFSLDQITEAINIYKQRYAALAQEDAKKYIMIFHNHGREAGASIYHPHSQIITTPILPPDVAHSINGSFQYYKKYGKRVYDVLLGWELKEKKRIIYENDHFVVFCPFISKYPYEIRIFSKESHAHFDKMPDELDQYLADALKFAIDKLGAVLNKPPFNFFIHTAPLESESKDLMHEYYQWHFEIIPHMKIDAGFEIGTGIEVNIIDPDEAADKLRNVKV